MVMHPLTPDREWLLEEFCAPLKPKTVHHALGKPLPTQYVANRQWMTVSIW